MCELCNKRDEIAEILDGLDCSDWLNVLIPLIQYALSIASPNGEGVAMIEFSTEKELLH